MSECQKSTYLLSDSPDSVDAFGSHSRLANAIKTMILNEQISKTIGLEGSWGSGKSTVINILQKELVDNKDMCFINFDSWAHEGDPLRRSFLEITINGLQQKAWISNDIWKKKKEELAKRRKVVTTENIPVLTRFSKIMAVLLLCIPFGSAILSAGFKTNGEINWCLTTIGSLVCFAPVIILLSTKVLCKSEADASWALFIHKTITNEKTEVIETPEPTSLEFEDYFMQMMQEALQDPAHRVILVVDNLDRVSPKDALTIWAALRTFLEKSDCGMANHKFLDRLWIIIPYDADGIKQIWASQGSSRENANGKKAVAQSFLDKIIQARFYVPLPVLTDWRNYLINLFAEIFPNVEEREFHQAYRLYNDHVVKNTPPPTPRQLKLYINSISTIYRQWEKTIPLSHIAYYCIMRESEHKDITEQILKNKISKSDKNMLGDTLEDNLVALVFNVEPAKARQVLLKQPIINSLGSPDGQTFKELVDNQQGLWEVLEAELPIILDSWKNVESDKIACAINNLAASNILNSSRHEVLAIRMAVAQAIRTIENWGELNEAVASAIRTINMEFRDVNLTSATIKAISPVGSDGLPIKDWLSVLVSILENAKQNDYLSACSENIVAVQSDANLFISLCNLLFDEGIERDFWPCFKFGEDPQKIGTRIMEIVNQGKFDIDTADSLYVMKKAGIAIDWQTILLAADNRLKAEITGPEMDSLLEFLYDNKDDEAANTILTAQCNTGRLLDNIWSASQNNEFSAIAKGIFVLSQYKPDFNWPTGYGNAGNGLHYVQSIINGSSTPTQKVLNEFIRIINNRSDYELVQNYIQTSTSLAQSWGQKCLIALLANNNVDPHDVFTSEFIINHWQKIKTYFSPEQTDLFFKKVLSDELYEAIRKQGYSKQISDLCVAIVEHTDSESFLMWYSQVIGRLGKEEWITHLNNEDEVFESMIALIKKGIAFTPSIEYCDAMENHAIELASERVNVSNPIDIWDTIIEMIDPSEIKTAFGRITEKLAELDGKLSEAFLDIYGKHLNKAGVLFDNPKLFSHIYNRILRDQYSRGVRWIVDGCLAEAFNLNNQPQEALEEFVKRVDSYINSGMDDELNRELLSIEEKIKAYCRNKAEAEDVEGSEQA